MLSLRGEDAKRALEYLTAGNIEWNVLKDRCTRRHGWSPDYAADILTEYQKFLVMKVATADYYDAEILSPPLIIDTMWHDTTF